MTRPMRVGAVMYDPKVSVIWEIIRRFFESQGAPTDVMFYSTYALQVSALVGGEIDIAFVGPVYTGDELTITGVVETVDFSDDGAVARVKLICKAGDRSILAGAAIQPISPIRKA